MSENKNFFRASAEDFKKIPGSPVAYWVSGGMRKAFSELPPLSSIAVCKQGIATANNDLFLRRWFEVSIQRISFGIESQESADRIGVKWLPYNKGGEYRKWYGNNEFVINWAEDGNEIRNFVDEKGRPRSAIRNENYFYLPSCTWSDISSSFFGARYSGGGTLFDGSGHSCFPSPTHVGLILTFLCSKLSTMFLRVINPTMHFQVGNVAQIPIENTPDLQEQTKIVFDRVLSVSRTDWDAYETSWDFAVNPLVAERGVSGQSVVGSEQNGGLITDHCPLSTLYSRLREKWASDCEEMRRLETENNRIFIEAYGLQDELTPDVPWHEITLTCNPWYRYGVKVDSGQRAVGSAPSDHCTLPTDHLLEERLKGDTVKELISYAVGCMMGRYSLEKPGLILADQGAQISDQWIVVSGQLVLRGKVAECVRKELQRIDCLAEGDGSCGRSVSTGETAPDGGTVCIVGSASSGGGFNSVECRRGAGAEYDAGLHELSDNGTRVVLRDGNTIVDLCSAEVLDAIASGSGAELVRRGWKDAERIDWKTIHSSLTTSHFSPDEDGIIPILDNDWFADDIVTRFKEFIKVAFGEVHFFENMAWIEEALGKNLRDYFTKDFYKDHLQRYQNRPIYWLFQSPKGAFRALVYMHRYKPDMVGGVLGYLRSLQTKVENQLGVATQIASDESKSSTERVRANKEVVKYAKMQKELDEYEKNVLYPLSTERIEIDLDDGVKVNYRKFGTALRKVAALEGKGE